MTSQCTTEFEYEFLVKCPSCGGMATVDGDGVSECPDCGNVFMSSLVIEKMNSIRKADRKARRVEEAGGLMADAGIPPKFRTVEADFELAERIANGKGLYLQGGSGTFKTLKAASIARAFLESGKTVKYVSTAMLMSEFRDTYSGSGSETDIFNSLFETDLLVLDDLGKENLSPWGISMLYAVIDGRYGYDRPVVVTSNYKRGELAALIASKGEAESARAIVSRLVEMTDTVDFGDDDRRLA